MSISQRILDFGVPLGLFLLFFFFYNFGKITPSEMVKNTGLLSIALLGITLAVAHFYIMETQNGILVIKRVAGQVTFVFAILVIVLRIMVLLLPAKRGYN